jgi:hypothetical protein
MDAQTLITECRTHGIELSNQNGSLIFDAPTGAMTDDLRAALRKHKSELLTLLATGDHPAPKTEPATLESEPGKPVKSGITITINGVTMPLDDWTERLWSHVVDGEPVSILFPMTIEQYRLYRQVTGRPDTKHEMDPSWCLSCQHHRCPEMTMECHHGGNVRRVIDLAACPDGKWSRPKQSHPDQECPSCRGVDFWQSIHGRRVCRLCHPPASPELEVSR